MGKKSSVKTLTLTGVMLHTVVLLSHPAAHQFESEITLDRGLLVCVETSPPKSALM